MKHLLSTMNGYHHTLTCWFIPVTYFILLHPSSNPLKIHGLRRDDRPSWNPIGEIRKTIGRALVWIRKSSVIKGWKWPIYSGLSHLMPLNMVIFHCYVSLPEGHELGFSEDFSSRWPWNGTKSDKWGLWKWSNRTGFVWVKQCHFYQPWLGMVTIPPIKLVMTGGWFTIIIGL